MSLPDGRDIATCKWIFKTKRNEQGEVSRYKARLVAREFSQKYGTDYDEVFAPVVRHTTFKVLPHVGKYDRADDRPKLAMLAANVGYQYWPDDRSRLG